MHCKGTINNCSAHLIIKVAVSKNLIKKLDYGDTYDFQDTRQNLDLNLRNNKYFGAKINKNKII